MSKKYLLRLSKTELELIQEILKTHVDGSKALYGAYLCLGCLENEKIIVDKSLNICNKIDKVLGVANDKAQPKPIENS